MSLLFSLTEMVRLASIPRKKNNIILDISEKWHVSLILVKAIQKVKVEHPVEG